MNNFRKHRQGADYGKSQIPWGLDFQKLDLLCRERTAKCQKMYGGKAEIINIKLRIFKRTDGRRKIKTRLSKLIVIPTRPLKIHTNTSHRN